MFGLPDKCVELIFEQAGIIAITDKQAKYVYVNKRWEEDTGIPREVAVGSYNHDLIEGSRAITAIRTGKAVTGDMLIRTKNGRDLPGVMTYMPIFNGDEVVGCFISSSFLSVDQAYAFLERIESITLEYEFLKGEMRKRSGTRYSVEDIIGESDAIKFLKEQIYFAGASNSTVLIEGETGTGKELVAHSIHSCSLRNVFPFVKVNCSAIPDNLMESEFFGYDEGTFTGAKKGGKRGKFEKAHLGSIFLDEVNHLNLTMQPKLLRVLQEKEIERLGTSESIPIDVRVIAASNVSLRKLVNCDQFREDLYYRLNILTIVMPPLRKRREDIPLLANHILQKLSKQMGRNMQGISKDALDYLKEREWHGNVRELQNIIERGMNAARKDFLTLECLRNQDGMEDTITVRKEGSFLSDYEDSSKPLSKRKECLEKEAILETLKSCNHNKTQAAKMLNISRTLLYKKLEKYQINESDILIHKGNHEMK
ncbi:sigma-54 interaction domain-containing protein [Sinanaerobacter chloroacetimidivorans]|uniref:Sigma 54-interacting transcriptional regulator n=1 Tax=Sinanaerobacter chloroacetimidivorans TaxID=2818044 RepID=A0A8J7W6S0_9FIRM|nr:sigma 54-interacting transcriptional regulator [Sinanaerobacter chloroacetimidivorans]MBR0600123.1 sigma 54-interacting transcriptional regulator [Sinanaerobacter chloroacetimidivorans]